MKCILCKAAKRFTDVVTQREWKNCVENFKMRKTKNKFRVLSMDLLYFYGIVVRKYYVFISK